MSGKNLQFLFGHCMTEPLTQTLMKPTALPEWNMTRDFPEWKWIMGRFDIYSQYFDIHPRFAMFDLKVYPSLFNKVLLRHKLIIFLDSHFYGYKNISSFIIKVLSLKMCFISCHQTKLKYLLYYIPCNDSRIFQH